jgi:hypothetical protein
MNIQNSISGHKTQCNTYCNIGYVIQHHVKCVMQLLTNDIPQFNFRLQTTKCLNTAIMLMQFLLGEKGLHIADACDTRAVISRHTTGVETNKQILLELQKQLFSKREKARTLYYVLLSDGYFPDANATDATDDQKYFPGHVFILEKVYDTLKRKHYFYFYQSYINKYSLSEHIEMNKGLKISGSRAQELINDLTGVLTAPSWSQENVRKWYDMTFADSTDLLDSQSKDKFFLCFRKAKTNTCLGKLRSYLNMKHKSLSKIDEKNMDDVYGNPNLYDNDIAPLSNKGMITEIESLLYKIHKSQIKKGQHNRMKTNSKNIKDP